MELVNPLRRPRTAAAASEEAAAAAATGDAALPAPDEHHHPPPRSWWECAMGPARWPGGSRPPAAPADSAPRPGTGALEGCAGFVFVMHPSNSVSELHRNVERVSLPELRLLERQLPPPGAGGGDGALAGPPAPGAGAPNEVFTTVGRAAFLKYLCDGFSRQGEDGAAVPSGRHVAAAVDSAAGRAMNPAWSEFLLPEPAPAEEWQQIGDDDHRQGGDVGADAAPGGDGASLGRSCVATAPDDDDDDDDDGVDASAARLSPAPTTVRRGRAATATASAAPLAAAASPPLRPEPVPTIEHEECWSRVFKQFTRDISREWFSVRSKRYTDPDDALVAVYRFMDAASLAMNEGRGGGGGSPSAAAAMPPSAEAEMPVPRRVLDAIRRLLASLFTRPGAESPDAAAPPPQRGTDGRLSERHREQLLWWAVREVILCAQQSVMALMVVLISGLLQPAAGAGDGTATSFVGELRVPERPPPDATAGAPSPEAAPSPPPAAASASASSSVGGHGGDPEGDVRAMRVDLREERPGVPVLYIRKLLRVASTSSGTDDCDTTSVLDVQIRLTVFDVTEDVELSWSILPPCAEQSAAELLRTDGGPAHSPAARCRPAPPGTTASAATRAAACECLGASSGFHRPGCARLAAPPSGGLGA